MSPREQEHEDPDDLFATTRMSLGEHIEELRMALWRAVKGFFVALVVGFFLAEPALSFIASPVERELMHYYTKRIKAQEKKLKEQMEAGKGEIAEANAVKPLPLTISTAELARALGVKPPGSEEETITLNFLYHPVQQAIDTLQATQVVKPPTLSALSVTEAFVIWMKVGLYIGLVLASPWIFWQIWMFIAAGLYPTEKRLVHYYLPISLGLFLGGVLLCEFLVLPIGVRYLLTFNEWLNIEPDLRLSEWLGFAILMPVIFGVAFQLPLVMFFLDRIGIVTVETYQKHWRIAIFVLLVLSALLQVSTDPFSMMAMAIPMFLLYALGIFLCKMSPKQTLDLDMEESEEMVEV